MDLFLLKRQKSPIDHNAYKFEYRMGTRNGLVVRLYRGFNINVARLPKLWRHTIKQSVTLVVCNRIVVRSVLEYRLSLFLCWWMRYSSKCSPQLKFPWKFTSVSPDLHRISVPLLSEPRHPKNSAHNNLWRFSGVRENSYRKKSSYCAQAHGSNHFEICYKFTNL